MTRLQDMTSTQRQSWLTLLADGTVFVWFWQKMTVGFSPVPIDYEIKEFGKIVFGLVVLTIVLHIIISVAFELAAQKAERGKDERDIGIERRGAFWGYRIMQIGIGIITIGVLMDAAFGSEYITPIRFETPVQIIFGLAVVSYIADLVKHGVMVVGYGR